MPFRERFVLFFSWISGFFLLCSISMVLGFLIYKGWGSLKLGLIFGSTPVLDALTLKRPVFNGLFPAIAGTFLLVILSVGFAIPVGVASGIYMAEYARPGIKKFFGLLFDILAGVPSIVIGLFGFALAVFLHKQFSEAIYPSLLISSISLAFLVLPYIIRTTQLALEGLPRETRFTAEALGATKLQNIVHVLLPASLPSLLSGVILAVGRCAEDTAVIMLTGVVASAGIPKSLLAKYEALPFYIYYISAQYTNPEELMTGYGASLILLVICSFLFFVAFAFQRGIRHRVFYRP